MQGQSVPSIFFTKKNLAPREAKEGWIIPNARDSLIYFSIDPLSEQYTTFLTAGELTMDKTKKRKVCEENRMFNGLMGMLRG